MIRFRDDSMGDLFAIPEPAPACAGGMDYRTLVATIVADMLEHAQRVHGLDRFQVSADLSRLVGKEISKAVLDGYTAPSRSEFNAPAWLMPALMHVCRINSYADWLAVTLGGRLALGAAALDSTIVEFDEQIAHLRDKVRGLKNLRRRVR